MEDPNQSQINTFREVRQTGEHNVINFAPVQNISYVETKVTQISVDAITQNPLNRRSPYKGLKRFNYSDRDYLFGRDLLINRLLTAVNEKSFNLILGASGSGKSSLIRAGLIPEFEKVVAPTLAPNNFYNFIFTPATDPFESFYRCLLSEDQNYYFNEAQASPAKAGLPDTFPQVIDTLQRAGDRWLIFVDQFEQLFTSCDSVDRRNNFIDGLAKVAQSERSVHLILAMRSDFLEELSLHARLGSIANESVHIVTHMYPDQLQEAIEQPAAKHGVVFEQDLVKKIIADVEGQSGYLPLLQYTLDLLWDYENKLMDQSETEGLGDRHLNRASYNALEGVRGALQKRIDSIYLHFNDDEKLATRKIFLNLVNIVETETGNKVASRKASRAQFEGSLIQRVLQQFIDENLLVSSDEYVKPEAPTLDQRTRYEQHATVELAHEIILYSWQELKTWLEEEKEIIILKAWVSGEAKRWVRIRQSQPAKATDELMKGTRLDQILELRQKNAFAKLNGLTDEENEYIDASDRQRKALNLQRRQRRQQSIIAAVVLVAAILLGVFAVFQARHQKQLADQKESTLRSVTLADASQENLATDPVLSALLATQALLTQTTPQSINAAAASLRSIYEQVHLVGHQGAVRHAEFSPESDRTLLTIGTDGTARLWQLDSPNSPQVLRMSPNQSITDGRFNPFNPDQILLMGRDGSVHLWQPSTNYINSLYSHSAPISEVAFATQVQQLLTIGANGTAFVWDLSKQGDAPVQLSDRNDDIGELWTGAIDPQNANRVMVAGQDGSVRIWNLLQPDLPAIRIVAHGGGVTDAHFVPGDSNRMLTVGGDGDVKLWDLQAPEAPIEVFSGHAGSVLQAQFNPYDANVVATSGTDQTVRLWNLNKPDGGITLKDNMGDITAIAFDPHEAGRLLTTSTDGYARLWNLNAIEEPPLLLVGHQNDIHTGQFNPKQPGIILTAGDDGTTRIWSINAPDDHLLQLPREAASAQLVDGVFVANQHDQIRVLDWNGILTQRSITNFQSGDFVIDLQKNLSVGEISPNNTDLVAGVSASEDQVWVWNVGESQHPLWSHNQEGIRTVRFDPYHPDRLFVVRHQDVDVWNYRQNQIEASMTVPTPVSHIESTPHNKNQIVVTEQGGALTFWNLDHPQSPFRRLQVSQEALWRARFDPRDPNRLVTVGSDHQVRVWDTQRLQEPRLVLEGHQDTVVDGIFDRYNPNQIITASHDGTIKIWDLNNPGSAITLSGYTSGDIRLYGDERYPHHLLSTGNGIVTVHTMGGDPLIELMLTRINRCFSPQEMAHFNVSNSDLVSVFDHLTTEMSNSLESNMSGQIHAWNTPYCQETLNSEALNR